MLRNSSDPEQTAYDHAVQWMDRDFSDAPRSSKDTRSVISGWWRRVAPASRIESGADFIPAFNDHQLDKKKPVAPSSCFDVARAIRSGRCKQIIVMVGADSKGSEDHLNSLPTTAHFAEDPAEFYYSHAPMLVSRGAYGKQSGQLPLIYAFIKVLADRGLLRRVYSMVYGGLARLAVPDHLLRDCVGGFHSARCTSCFSPVNPTELNHWCLSPGPSTTTSSFRLATVNGRSRLVPVCLFCSGPIRPDLVLEGDSVMPSFFQSLEQDALQSDCLIMFGNRCRNFHPGAQLFHAVPVHVPRILFDDSRYAAQNAADFQFMVGPIRPFEWTKPGGRDVFLGGLVHERLKQLIELLDWQSDVVQAVAVTRFTPRGNNHGIVIETV